MYECIHELRKEFCIEDLCKMAGVSRSGYYKWLCRKGRLNRWQLEEKDLMNRVKAVHSVRPSFGYRRVADRIRKDTGWNMSDKRVLRCMQKLDIQSRVRRKRNYEVGGVHQIFPNLLNRDFQPTRPLEKITTDVTYLYSRGKVQYMSVFLDLYNNEILEYEVSDRNDLQLVIRPLKRLLTKRKKDVTGTTTIHSNQGSQYTSKAYTLLLKQYGIKQSMSRKGTPLDNAPVESFFGWFKNELYTDYRPKSPEELLHAIKAHTCFHNHQRPQMKLKNQAPILIE
ncbi:IS3 family transposase [Paenactinomyces guangxiensis]|uniref:IS3 family transposase n=1 Tax=Paenactinomyces guangxiensis TaxID=1490290 RepID=A0A7W1WT05_9BACL|nr:IS3 family transposase [Paenactinomyces guangxiensis]